MVAKEYCCYTRPYSSIEGFQIAHTLYYSASVEEEGVVLAVRRQQGEECVTEQVICPVGDFGRLMSLMRYLCENGVGLGHWLDVLDDAGQVYWPCTAANGQQGLDILEKEAQSISAILLDIQMPVMNGF